MNNLNPNHDDSDKPFPLRLLSGFIRLWNYPIIIRIPKIPSSIPSLIPEKKNHAMTNYEIKMSMLNSSVYKIGKNRFPLKSKSNQGKLELYCFSKTDAQDLKRAVLEDDDGEEVFDTQLAQVVELEGRMPPISLVPDLEQVKNAIELMKKDRKKGMADLSFSGVPVFQSDCLKIHIPGEEVTYTPLYFRKEDLEGHIKTFIQPENRGIVKVSAFEDIIQKMKDNSTEESNNVRFVVPGKTNIKKNPFK